MERAREYKQLAVGACGCNIHRSITCGAAAQCSQPDGGSTVPCCSVSLTVIYIAMCACAGWLAGNNRSLGFIAWPTWRQRCNDMRMMGVDLIVMTACPGPDSTVRRDASQSMGHIDWTFTPTTPVQIQSPEIQRIIYRTDLYIKPAIQHTARMTNFDGTFDL